MRDPAAVVSTADELARQADALMNHPAMRAALDRLAGHYTATWRAAPPGPCGLEARETAHGQLQALQALVEDLQAVISGARIVQHNLGPALRRRGID